MKNKIKCRIGIVFVCCMFAVFENSMMAMAQEFNRGIGQTTQIENTVEFGKNAEVEMSAGVTDNIEEGKNEEAGKSSENGNSTEAAKEGTAQANTISSNPLLLDNTNLYQGMKTAYKNGYSPAVSKNQTEIILPLYFEKTSGVTSIRAVLDLGTVDNSPFVYKNYSKTVEKSKEKINHSKTEKEVFLIKFKIGLKNERINGAYPVVIKVSYSENGEEMVQEFPVYVNITDGKETLDDNVEVGESETKQTSEPKLIVVKNELSTDRILSGSEFTSTVTLKNTNKNKYIQNLTVTAICETEGISLQNDSNVFYFDKLEADNTMELSLKFAVDEGVSEGRYIAKLSFSYDNPEASALTSEGEIAFQIYQNMRVGFEAGEVISEINAGDSVSVPIQVMNLGRSMIYNVRCNVEGTGLSASKSLFIGNLEAGTAGSGELVLFAGMVNADAENDSERYGNAYGKIIMTYEDAEGNPYTEEKEYYTNILPIEIKSSEREPEKNETNIGKQLMAGVAIVIALAVIGGLVTAWIHQRKKKATLLEEENQ